MGIESLGSCLSNMDCIPKRDYSDLKASVSPGNKLLSEESPLSDMIRIPYQRINLSSIEVVAVWLKWGLKCLA